MGDNADVFLLEGFDSHKRGDISDIGFDTEIEVCLAQNLSDRIVNKSDQRKVIGTEVKPGMVFAELDLDRIDVLVNGHCRQLDQQLTQCTG